MTAQQPSDKAAISVSEMADLCGLSRSRFYDLLDAGVFPKPVRNPSLKRPIYDRQLQDKCLEIRQSGIGLNGVPVLFNRKSRRPQAGKSQRAVTPEPKQDHADLIVALKGLGLNSTSEAVRAAVASLFPAGLAGIDQGDVIRKVFLHLQSSKK